MDCTQQQIVNLKPEVDSVSSGNKTPTSRDPIVSDLQKNLNYSVLNHRKIMESSFYMFPESPEETKLRKARAILGEVAKDISDEELAIYLTQFEYLLDSWLDIYEKQIFNNLTLQQLLREG